LRAEVNFGGYYDDYDPTMDYDADLWRVSYRHQL
jgi:hypothetical protein